MPEQPPGMPADTSSIALSEPPSWWQAGLGQTDQVLPPFTPLVPDGTRIHVLGRSYAFRESPFPTEAAAAGAELLAGPIRLVAARRHGVERLQVDTLRFAEVTPGRAVLVGRGRLGEQLVVQSTTVVEEDGLVWVTLELDPDRPVELEDLALEVPLCAEHAQYIHRVSRAGDWSESGADALPDGNGVLWSSGFRPQVWLGDEDRGLAWFTEAEGIWQEFAGDHEALELVEEDGIRVLIRDARAGAPA
jgi:hypothetical protein